MAYLRILTAILALATGLSLTTLPASAQECPDNICPELPPPPVDRTPTGSIAPTEATKLICFYTQPEYKGHFYCESGNRRVSAVDIPWRDEIVSIRIVGDISVQICKNEQLDGTCETIDASRPELSSDLAKHVYSYRTRDY